MKQAQIAWMEKHGKDAEWMMQVGEAGFDVHHLDCDEKNNDHGNLVMVYCSDHMELHGPGKMTRTHKGWQEAGKAASERLNKGQTAYEMRTTGMYWEDIAKKLRVKSVVNHAKYYALANDMAWPVPTEHNSTVS